MENARSPVPVLAPRPSALDLLRGFSLPFASVRLLFRSGKLFTLAAISGVVTFVSLVVLTWLLAVYTDDLLSRFWERPASAWAQAGWYLVLALTFVVLLFVGANSVPLALQAPLQDPLSEATEALCGDAGSAKLGAGAFARGVATSVAYTLTRILLLLAGHAVLLLLHLVPGAGSLLWSLAASAWTIYWTVIEYVGSPMARHLYPFSAVRAAVRGRLALCFGFGLAVYLLLWVPLLNLFFIPLAVIGGTLLFRALRDAGLIPPPPTPAAK